MIKEAEDLDWSDAERLVRDFTKVAQPLAFDPRWNRLWAILWDGPQGDSIESLDYWAKYIANIEEVPGFNSSGARPGEGDGV